MSETKLNELVKKANNFLDKGDLSNALMCANNTLNLGIEGIFAGSAIFINIGMVMKNSSILQKGIDLLEDNFDEIQKDENYRGSLYYNLGNGYSNSYYIQRSRSKDKCFGCFKETKLDKAIEYYRESFNCKMNKGVLTKAFVNIGNCYDSQGRVIDALEFYNGALEYNPEFGMALANKGSAILNYAHLISNRDLKIDYYIEAYNLLLDGLEKGVIPEAKLGFDKILKWLDDRLQNKEVFKKHPQESKIRVKYKSEFERVFINFCLENKLYLNVCNYCQKCEYAIGDPIVIPRMIVEVNKDNNKDFLKSDTFLRLSGYINQIKQDYISARYLLILSQYKGFGIDFIDKKVSLIDTLDYRKYNIYIQLMKTSFKEFYNILDKIAFFINDYLEIGECEKNVSFHRIWHSDSNDIRENIRNTKNISLNAIFKIYVDLSKDGYHSYLKDIRNALTHRFINIYHFKEEDSEKMIEEDLFNYTLKLVKLTRNAIMYLISFIYLEEIKKEKDLKGFIPPMFARQIPNELKI